MVKEITYRRQGFTNPSIINDATVLNGYVEIYAHKHPLAFHVNVTNGLLIHNHSARGNSSTDSPRSQTFVCHEFRKVGHTARIAPFVVVPGNDLEQIPADDHRQQTVHNG